MEGTDTSQKEMKNSATVVVKCFGFECCFLEEAIKAFLKCFGFENNIESSKSGEEKEKGSSPSSLRSEKDGENGEVKESSTGSNTGKEATDEEEADPPSTAQSSAVDPSTAISVEEAASLPPINPGSGPQNN